MITQIFFQSHQNAFDSKTTSLNFTESIPRKAKERKATLTDKERRRTIHLNRSKKLYSNNYYFCLKFENDRG